MLYQLVPGGVRGRDLPGVAVREQRDRRVVEVTPSSAAAIPSAASDMIGECAATDTGSTITLRAPSSLPISTDASIAARSPLTTTWPGALRFATPKIPC